jgi:hypothetical protein
MSLSQFDPVLKRSTSQPARAGDIRIDVGGPLKLDPDVQYTKPFVIHYTIIQSDEGVHEPALAKRVSGVVETDGADNRWEDFVDVEPDFFESGEARGIGVAVLQQTSEFAYETLTWCDHVNLDLDGATGA